MQANIRFKMFLLSLKDSVAMEKRQYELKCPFEGCPDDCPLSVIVYGGANGELGDVMYSTGEDSDGAAVTVCKKGDTAMVLELMSDCEGVRKAGKPCKLNLTIEGSKKDEIIKYILDKFNEPIIKIVKDTVS